MAGTEMVIMWQNSDGNITVSQRKGTGESEPPVNSNPSRLAALSNSLSSVGANFIRREILSTYFFSLLDRLLELSNTPLLWMCAIFF